MPLLALLACAELPPPTVVRSATIGTVGLASWSANVEGRTRVVVSEGGVPWIASDWQEPTLIHEAVLLGLHADGEYAVHVEAEVGGTSEPTDFATGSLPPEVSEPTVTGEPAWGGWLLTSMVSGTGTGPLLLDPAGRVVWWGLRQGEGRATRARLRPDGAGVWYGYVESEAEDKSGLLALDWQGTQLASIPAPAFSHDFVVRPDGSLAWIEFDRRLLADDLPVWGNRIVEGDPETQTEVFSTFDLWEPGVDGEVGDDGYWTGVNALDLDPDLDRYTFGSRGLGAIVTLDRADGSAVQQIGGPRSDYAFGPDARLQRNHQFELLDGAVLVHDNRDETVGSRAVELALDDDAGTAEVRWEWQHDPPLFVYALGDVDRLDDGGTLITWTTAGVIDDVGPDDAPRASVSLPLGSVFGFSERLDRLPGMQAP